MVKVKEEIDIGIDGVIHRIVVDYQEGVEMVIQRYDLLWFCFVWCYVLIGAELVLCFLCFWLFVVFCVFGAVFSFAHVSGCSFFCFPSLLCFASFFPFLSFFLLFFFFNFCFFNFFLSFFHVVTLSLCFECD